MLTDGYSIFLDDEREVAENYIIDIMGMTVVRSYDDAVALVNHFGLPKFISFDHDLGTEKTGYDFAKFLVEYCMDNKLDPAFTWCVHSQNPVGAKNINEYLMNFIRNYEANNA